MPLVPRKRKTFKITFFFVDIWISIAKILCDIHGMCLLTLGYVKVCVLTCKYEDSITIFSLPKTRALTLPHVWILALFELTRQTLKQAKNTNTANFMLICFFLSAIYSMLKIDSMNSVVGLNETDSTTSTKRYLFHNVWRSYLFSLMFSDCLTVSFCNMISPEQLNWVLSILWAYWIIIPASFDIFNHSVIELSMNFDISEATQIAKDFHRQQILKNLRLNKVFRSFLSTFLICVVIFRDKIENQNLKSHFTSELSGKYWDYK